METDSPAQIEEPPRKVPCRENMPIFFPHEKSVSSSMLPAYACPMPVVPAEAKPVEPSPKPPGGGGWFQKPPHL